MAQMIKVPVNDLRRLLEGLNHDWIPRTFQDSFDRLSLAVGEYDDEWTAAHEPRSAAASVVDEAPNHTDAEVPHDA